MNDEEFTKDRLDNVSGQLRKAVGQNRHEMGGLRNIVSQMKRDRNRSVGLLSKRQQEFLQKQSKLLPAVNMRKASRKISSQVIPLSHEVLSLPKDNHTLPKSGIFGPTYSTQFSVLPPIRSDGKSTKDFSSVESEAKLRRISDYRKECSSLQESLVNAHIFASGNREESRSLAVHRHEDSSHDETSLDPNYRGFLQNHKEKGDKTFEGRYKAANDTKDSSGYLRKLERLSNETTQRKSVLKGKQTLSQSVSSNDETENTNEDVSKKANIDNLCEVNELKKKNYWEVVRQSLGFIIAMNKQNQSKYCEQLFQEIRRCRYIRRPRKRDSSAGIWYERGEESEDEQS